MLSEPSFKTEHVENSILSDFFKFLESPGRPKSKQIFKKSQKTQKNQIKQNVYFSTSFFLDFLRL